VLLVEQAERMLRVDAERDDLARARSNQRQITIVRAPQRQRRAFILEQNGGIGAGLADDRAMLGSGAAPVGWWVPPSR